MGEGALTASEGDWTGYRRVTVARGEDHSEKRVQAISDLAHSNMKPRYLQTLAGS